jgi:hypothetical protein
MVEEHWLPLAEAARILGISVDAARRKVKSGALPAEKRETPQGGTWWVRLAPHGEPPPATLRQAPSGANSPAFPDRDLSSLVSLVERLQTQLLERTEAATLWQARAHMLEDRIRALEAPRTHVGANLTAQAPDPTTEPPEPPRRPDPFPAPIPPDEYGRHPWWQRWWLRWVIAL